MMTIRGYFTTKKQAVAAARAAGISPSNIRSTATGKKIHVRRHGRSLSPAAGVMVRRGFAAPKYQPKDMAKDLMAQLELAELRVLSDTSLERPLTPAQQERMTLLFTKYYGEIPK